MQLTRAQPTILGTAIRASTDQRVIDAVATGNVNAIWPIYNEPSAFTVWRSTIDVDEYRTAIVWTEVADAAMTIAKARIWEWMTSNMSLPLYTASATVRTGLADCWGATTVTRANLLVMAKRYANKVEVLFATGTGTVATPGSLGWEGTATLDMVTYALYPESIPDSY